MISKRIALALILFYEFACSYDNFKLTKSQDWNWEDVYAWDVYFKKFELARVVIRKRRRKKFVRVVVLVNSCDF